MGVITDAVTSGWVLYPLTGLGVFTAGLWADYLLRRVKRRGEMEPVQPTELILSFRGQMMSGPLQLLALSVLNNGQPRTVVAKVLPPRGFTYEDKDLVSFLEMPAAWADEVGGSTRLLTGEEATLNFASVDPDKRQIMAHYTKRDGTLGSWIIRKLPIDKQINFPARLLLTSDPPLGNGPLRKTITFDITFYESGGCYIESDPAKIIDGW